MFGLSAQTMDVLSLVLMILMLATPLVFLGRPEAFLRRMERRRDKKISEAKHND